MTVTISTSDAIYEAAEQFARQLGISFDELCELALIRHLQKIQLTSVAAPPAEKSTIKRLNEIHCKHDSRLNPLFVGMQARSIPQEEW